MLVGVTGGTGFLGAHSVAAITRSGHRVRLLVRDESRVAPALSPLGVDPGAVDVRVGDITDEVSVSQFVKGSDAILHAAAVYSFDSRRKRELLRVNAVGTDVVLRIARRLGAGPAIYVSSIVALIPSPQAALHQDSPIGTARESYAASKIAAEAIAREHQAAGAPVVITYPSALLGPHDPHLGDQTRRLRNALRGLMPLWPTGGYPIGDVRDTAQLHATLVDSAGSGAGRYFGPGRYVSTREFVGVLREVTGRALPTAYLPGRAMLPVGRMTSVLQRVWPWYIPAEYGALYICIHAARVDGNAPTAGIAARPLTDTVSDTVRWLLGSGLLTGRQAGRLRSAVTENAGP